MLFRWSAAFLLLSLAASAAHATEAPPERDSGEKPNTPPRFSGRLGIDPIGDFEFTQGASLLKVGRKTSVAIGAHDADGDGLTFSVEPLRR